MVLLFAFEFIEGNTITRLYFMRLRRLTRQALGVGRATLELARARSEQRLSRLAQKLIQIVDIPEGVLLGYLCHSMFSIHSNQRASNTCEDFRARLYPNHGCIVFRV